jgi:carboxyl-terminal processing protease
MRRLLRIFRAPAAAWLFACAAASLAAPPALTDEVLAPLTSAYMGAVAPGEEAETHRELLATVVRQVLQNYAREVDVGALTAAARKAIEAVEPQSGEPEEVFRKAVNAALASLDPHSRYLDPRAQIAQRSAAAGSFSGLGLQVDMADGLIRVIRAMPGTPAARAGLQNGDLIVHFDGESVQGMTLSDAVARMRGEPGTPIELTIRRTGHEADFTVSLVRETIRAQNVRWSMEGDVLVLRLASFTGAVSSAVEKAVAEASAVGALRAVVLDLRGNGGGLIWQAVRTADAFLAEGDIVSLRGRTPANQRSWQATSAHQLAGVPIVVLIDSRTASAAELLAAALQENGRATVMGRRSFGKGSVQSELGLGEGRGALLLTTALYYGPSGRSVQRTGVGPDIELVLAPEVQQGVPRREANRARALTGADEPLQPKARVEQARCGAAVHAGLDAGLACALAFLEAGAIDRFVAALESEASPHHASSEQN